MPNARFCLLCSCQSREQHSKSEHGFVMRADSLRCGVLNARATLTYHGCNWVAWLLGLSLHRLDPRKQTREYVGQQYHYCSLCWFLQCRHTPKSGITLPVKACCDYGKQAWHMDVLLACDRYHHVTALNVGDREHRRRPWCGLLRSHLK